MFLVSHKYLTLCRNKLEWAEILAKTRSQVKTLGAFLPSGLIKCFLPLIHCSRRVCSKLANV